LPCCCSTTSPADVYRTAAKFQELRDQAILAVDLPYVRTELVLEEWPGILGRWTSATTVPGQATRPPVTVITAGGNQGGTSGPCHGEANHLDPSSQGLYDELARSLPGRGVSVLQVAYRQPGARRFDECVGDVVLAATMAAERGHHLFLLGHSMGGAVVLAAATKVPLDRLLGVCPLSPQTRGVPTAVALRPMLEGNAGLLILHGAADKMLPPACSEQIWQRLSGSTAEEGCEPPSSHRRLVLLEDAGHHLMERREEVVHLVREWILELLLAAVQV